MLHKSCLENPPKLENNSYCNIAQNIWVYRTLHRAVCLRFRTSPLTSWPGGRKFCKITQKGPEKISFGREILVAVRPQILTKSGRKGAGKHFLTVFSFFRGSSVWKKVNFWGFEFGSVTKYFILKPLKKC